MTAYLVERSWTKLTLNMKAIFRIVRQLFYIIVSSYITLYLAIVFLVVANTIVGVQFLMSQQKNQRRMQTLIRLQSYFIETLCQSAGKQITWFMGLLYWLRLSAVLFWSQALFTGILSSWNKYRTGLK